jgi:hypothetical protein
MLEMFLHHTLRCTGERPFMLVIVFSMQRLAQEINAMELVEDVDTGEVLSGAVVFVEEDGIVLIVDCFPLLLGDANGAAHRCYEDYYGSLLERKED